MRIVLVTNVFISAAHGIGRYPPLSGLEQLHRGNELMITRKTKNLQGLKESAKAIALLQEKWPDAFPKKYGAVKPLARSVKQAIVAGTGWNKDYAHGVLVAWKSRMAYCDAVLRDATRIDIDGNATDEAVDDTSRALAEQKRKQTLEARRRRAARQAGKASDRTGISHHSSGCDSAPQILPA
jgi:sRNA-binding protein